MTASTNYTAILEFDLQGFVITFESGEKAHTQLEKEENKLHADCGDSYHKRYPDYDDVLSLEQHAEVDHIIALANKDLFDGLTKYSYVKSA